MSVGRELLQLQIHIFDGQNPAAQLITHHWSMSALPFHTPVALHPPWLVVGWDGDWVLVWDCVLVVGTGVLVVPGGAVLFGTTPPSPVILMSAQLTNVSWSPFPIPQPWSSHPQLLPTFHHHWITQWSHVKPGGSNSLIFSSFGPIPPSGYRVLFWGVFKRYVSFSWVIGGLPILPTLNSNHPLWLAVMWIYRERKWT